MAISIHLPVANLDSSDQFCAGLGLRKLLPLSSDTRSTWELGPGARVVAHSLSEFSNYLRNGDQPDLPSGARQMFVTVEVDSAQAVNDFVAAALAGGGQVYRSAIEESRGRYTGSVRDPDGHVWEAGFTDPRAAQDVPWT